MRNGAIIYFCKRTSKPQDPYETFAKPIEIRLKPNYLTIQPASGYMDLLEFGEFTKITHKGIASPYERWEHYFNEGDRIYLNVVPSGYLDDLEPEDGWGYDADTQIVAVKGQNKVISLTIQNIIR